MYALVAYQYGGGFNDGRVEKTVIGVGPIERKLMTYQHRIEDWSYDPKGDYRYIGHAVYPDFTVERILHIK